MLAEINVFLDMPSSCVEIVEAIEVPLLLSFCRCPSFVAQFFNIWLDLTLT
jgi:hypothetical protein